MRQASISINATDSWPSSVRAFERRHAEVLALEREREPHSRVLKKRVKSVSTLIPLYVWWQPLPAVVWQAQTPAIAALCTGLFALGFGLVLVLVSTFLIDHFDLFGLRKCSCTCATSRTKRCRFRCGSCIAWCVIRSTSVGSSRSGPPPS